MDTMNKQALVRRAVSASAIATMLGLALAGCTTMGTGTGSMDAGKSPVSFAWTSKDGGSTGTMTANIAGQGAYTGQFVQVSNTVQAQVYEPMWRGWRRGWSDWGYWGMQPETAFATVYSGKVVANLTGPNATPLRCRFHLNNAAAGMSGGGQGECQFTDGKTVSAVFSKT